MTNADPRRVLLLAHTGREEAREVARAYVKLLNDHDIIVRLLPDEAAELGLAAEDGRIEIADGEPDAGHASELAVVIGGDGTILRAAEITHASGTPVLGVNLGHVGFLAEAEVEHVDTTIQAIVDRRYTTEDRLTLDVTVLHDGRQVSSTFALNEASVEKAARERMLEVVLEIDGRPLSRFGCDGVVCSTPTGSTAYSFSAGGSILDPRLRNMIITPVAAYLSPLHSVVAGEDHQVNLILREAHDGALVSLDGQLDLPMAIGDRVEVRALPEPMRMIEPTGSTPFYDLLRTKASLLPY